MIWYIIAHRLKFYTLYWICQVAEIRITTPSINCAPLQTKPSLTDAPQTNSSWPTLQYKPNLVLPTLHHKENLLYQRSNLWGTLVGLAFLVTKIKHMKTIFCSSNWGRAEGWANPRFPRHSHRPLTTHRINLISGPYHTIYNTSNIDNIYV